VTVDLRIRSEQDGWVADVTVAADRTTHHIVRVTRGEYEAYGRGDAEDLVRRSLAFLLAREPNTSILRVFSLSDIERYFPEYAKEIRT